MVKTVSSAFDEFLKDKVNLESNQTNMARASRDNLINNINGFSGNDDFFTIYQERNLKFGSFARRTKIRPLDDIDLMICFSSEGKRTYSIADSCIYINGADSDLEKGLMHDDNRHLNSTKVINRLIRKLTNLNDYGKAEMHKNMEAATLQLKSYTWNFDIVPCFYTDTGLYLIPDGKGNWKKTDPRIDNTRTTNDNQKHKGKILNVIRLIKYWNNRKATIRINSYLLECMILSYYEGVSDKLSYWHDAELRDVFLSLSSQILQNVFDPKNLQGNLNYFTYEERYKISNSLFDVYQKAYQAVNLNINEQDKEAIDKWREIFGDAFPEYD